MSMENNIDLDRLVIVFASFRPKPGESERVKEILDKMIAPTRNEPGNMIYNFYRGAAAGDGEVNFHLFEQYKDQVALQAHRDSAHYKAYRAAIGDHLAEPISVAVLSAIDVVS